MDLYHFAIVFGAGLAAGIMNAVAGGGTIVTFPALMFAGITPIMANATSTVALIPSTLSYTIAYRKNIPPVWNWIKKFALVNLAGGLVGGILLVKTPPGVFNKLVPFLVLLATMLFTTQSFFVRLFRLEVRKAPHEHNARWMIGATLFQFVVSVYGGYFGAGMGILMLAAMGLLGVGNIHEMNTVKGFIGVLVNVVAAIYFVISGLVRWDSAGVMALGAIIGGYSGAHFAQKIPHKTVRHLITGIGLILTLYTFKKQFGY